MKKIFRIVIIGLLGLVIGAYFFVDSLHVSINHLVALFSSMDIESVIAYIRNLWCLCRLLHHFY